ncbi:MAG: DNA primase, partial [Clostridia bacterium]|nr:DNA primase [Clostridia bacterium]
LVEEIRSRNDIVELIGSYVNLKRAGSNFGGLCPYHSEKTPSFTVFPATKSFYCFGCGAGGDAITFVMRTENLDYRAAIEVLAHRAGITIPEDDSHTEDTVPRKRIYEMNLAAAKFFRNCLFDDKYGKEALAYLHEERKLSMATIKHFGLGFSPDNAWMLTNHMKKLGFTDDELVTGFLCGKSRNSGRTYDYFRNRVIFPIIDTAGNIVAFGGRVMDDSKPKYLNTSDTPAFKKSRHLFALNFAKKYSEEQMLLCEGYMDVIALHAAGFENAVATLGTAITAEQARIFAKHTKKVIICYDADSAGQNAAQKAMRLLGEVGIEVRVLKLAGAKDPDEYIKKFGVENFKRTLGESKTGFDYNLEKIASGYDLSLPEEKIKASADVCALISGAYAEVEREIYIMRAAQRLDISADALRSDVERVRRAKMREAKQKESRDAQLSVKNIGDRVNPDAAKYIKATAAEEALLGLMLIFDEFRALAARGDVPIRADDFVTDFSKRVFCALCDLENSEAGFSKAMLGQFFNVDEMGRIEKIEIERRRLARNDREVFLSCIESIKAEKTKLSENSQADRFDDLRRMQEALKNKKKEKNT